MHEENEGEEFTAVPEAQLKQWGDEAGYTYQGLYTNIEDISVAIDSLLLRKD